jgi:acetolactate synthase-1/2/3 large subunit
MMTGAQALVESLKKEHVTHIFGYGGATICPVVDVIAGSDIEYVLVRTEQNAGHMASGYARISGKVGVCMVTSGPGATNLLTGIATAYMDSIPIVAITGQVESYLLGRDIFQEVDITGAASQFTKHSYLVKDVRDIPRIVKEAFHIASTGRQGPVLIDIPVNIQKETAEIVFPDSVNIRGYKPSVKGNALQIKKIAAAIDGDQRPLICAGGGIFSAGAKEELEQLAVSAGIPVVTTMMGLGLLPTEHPLNIGMIGAYGTRAANIALNMADLLIIAGARVANRAIPSAADMARRTKTIHIDVDPSEIGKNVSTTVPVVGDVKAILQQILKYESKADATEWTAELQSRKVKDASKFTLGREGYVAPKALMRELGRKMHSDACVCVDVGQHQIWAAKHLPLNGARFLTSGGLGTMGYSLPAALGVKTADPKRQTLVICGDGGFQMFMCELATMRAVGADIKIVLLENKLLGLINELQDIAQMRRFGTALDGAPDYRQLAAAYGISYGAVTESCDVPAAVDEMFRTPGPYLLVCAIDPEAKTSDFDSVEGGAVI